MPILSTFLSGAIFAASLAIALHFWRLWRRTRDRLFAYFIAAFLVLALERVVLATVDTDNEFAPFVYVVRLIGFLLIIAGVIDKNRGR